MKAHDNGSLFSVSISARDVSDFNDRWPCSPIPERGIWAQFDKRNGDLVDLSPDTSSFDGEALLALIQDGQNYAAKRLGLPAACFRR